MSHFYSILVLLFIGVHFPFYLQSQNCCVDGNEFSVALSGSCQRILPSSGTARSGTYTIDRIRDTEGAVIELLNGDLLAVWSKFTNQGRDESAGWLVGRRSSDGGQNWGAEFPVSGVLGMQNSFSPSLLRLSNDDILLFVLAKHDHYEEDILVMRSTDDAQSWGCPVEINKGLQQAYHVMNNDRVIQLTFGPDSGRIICPVAFSPDVLKSKNPSSQFKCVTFYSDDNGTSWNKGNELIAPNGYERGIMEPAIVELINGSLMMLMRTRNGHFLKSISNDGGINWSTSVPLKVSPSGANISTPEAPCSIKRIPCTGDLLLIYNNGTSNRKQLVCRISSDDGINWGPILTLEGGTNSSLQYAYTSINFIDNNILLTYYVHTPQNAPSVPIQTIEMKFRALPISWLYKTDAGPDIQDCWMTSMVLLDAELPLNATGSWSVVSDTNYFIGNPTDPKTSFGGSNQIYTLVWTVKYNALCVVSDTVIVDLTHCGPSLSRGDEIKDIDRNNTRPRFYLQPGQLVIDNLSEFILPAEIAIYEINGKLVWKGKIPINQRRYNIDLVNQSVSKGVYFVKLVSIYKGEGIGFKILLN